MSSPDFDLPIADARVFDITDDPLSYVKEEIRKMNEEYRVGRV